MSIIVYPENYKNHNSGLKGRSSIEYLTKQVTYEAFLKTELTEREPVLYEILWDGVKYEILINPIPGSNSAVIFGTGAII